MSKLAFRVRWPLLGVLLFGALGALLGYGIAVAVTIDLAEHALHQYMDDHSIDVEQPAAEAHTLLAAMNASLFPPCSEEELSFFRHLVFQSRFFKDVGRMRGSQLACSTTLSLAELPQTRYEPSFPGAAGAKIYTHVDALRVGTLTPVVIRLGDAYVAMSPYKQDALPPGMQLTLNSTMARGTPNYISGSHSTLPADVLTENTSGRTQKALYATHCSIRYSHCVTFFVPVETALREQRSLIAVCTATCGVFGGCFGLMSVLLYRQKKGIEQQLRRAIRRNKLHVVYQPLVDLTTRRVTGAEALVRWTDEDLLVIAPTVFIKIAEERGFVDRITRMVVHRVLADFGRYLAQHPGFRINVNVAASDLTDPAFHAMLEDALYQAKVSPGSLGIEITEGATAKHEPAIKAIAHLRHRGHCVSIDDFGTGYSSLAYLKDLAVDGIKIDRAFTSAIGTGAVTMGILPQILSIADALRLSVVAEGIETEAQCAYYKTNALPITGQGWLFGHPVPPEEFRLQWLEAMDSDIAAIDAEQASTAQRRKEDAASVQTTKHPVLAGRGVN